MPGASSTFEDIPFYRQWFRASPYSARRPGGDKLDETGALLHPRITVGCGRGHHEMCSGDCTPPTEFYVVGELHRYGLIPCECPCHPVVITPEDP